MRVNHIIGFVLVVFFMISCGGRKVVYNQPEVLRDGYYETAWINPHIVISDTLYTLIQAERVDSFYVKKTTDPLKETAPSLTIIIHQESCFTSINLLNDRGNIIQPLLAKNLLRGYYKITCNPERINIASSTTGVYFIKASYCGYTVIERITHQ